MGSMGQGLAEGFGSDYLSKRISKSYSLKDEWGGISCFVREQ